MTTHIFKDLPKDQLRYGIFDFDNSIVETESLFATFDCDLLNAVLEQAGLTPDLTRADVRALAGNNDVKKLQIIAERKGFDSALYLADFQNSRNAARATLFADHPVTIANGLYDLLDQLQDNRALATNKTRARLLPDMEIMGIADLFNVIVASDGLQKKPAPDVILKAMEGLSATPKVSVYFGDTVLDIQAALAAGTYAVGFIIEGIEGHEDRVEAMKDAGAHAVTDDYRDMIPYMNTSL